MINKNTPSIIIHPGLGKTATTAIQAHGKSLPTDQSNKVCFSPFGWESGAHNSFAVCHPIFNAAQYKKAIEQTILFCKERSSPTVISSEFLIWEKPVHIKNLIDLFKESGVEVSIVIAIRSYVDYIVSAYKQAGKVNFGIKPHENLVQFTERTLKALRLPALIDKWAKYVGNENIYLADYDQYRINFVEYFFGFLNVGPNNEASLKENINTSISLSSVGVIRQFDSVSNDASARTNLLDLLSKVKFKEENEQQAIRRVENIVGNKYEEDFKIISEKYHVINNENT